MPQWWNWQEGTKMKDQYNEKVPELVLIPQFDLEDLTEEFLSIIYGSDWYDVNIDQDEETPTAYLMAPWEQIWGLGYDYLWVNPEDEIVGEELGGVLIEIMKVPDNLKRFSFEDGFYHA